MWERSWQTSGNIHSNCSEDVFNMRQTQNWKETQKEYK